MKDVVIDHLFSGANSNPNVEIEEYAEGKFKGTYIAKESGKFINEIRNFSADEYIHSYLNFVFYNRSIVQFSNLRCSIL